MSQSEFVQSMWQRQTEPRRRVWVWDEWTPEEEEAWHDYIQAVTNGYRTEEEKEKEHDNE